MEKDRVPEITDQEDQEKEAEFLIDLDDFYDLLMEQQEQM